MKFETSLKTIEEIVNENYEFVIPVYQRPYVWDDEEIKKLLGDILNTFNSVYSLGSSYFVGNTYVIKSLNKNREKQFELIDGQQRFTTFWLLANAYKLLNIETDLTDYLEVTYPTKVKDIRFDFDIRIEVANYLKGLLDSSSYLKFSDASEKEFLKFIAKGVETIKHFILSEVQEEKRSDFGNFIYQNVCFVFNVAPQNTDLNALFTALGTSGIQLQQSDILKARLLEKISRDSREKFSKIWDVCEDMSNYFEKNIADVFNIDRSNIKPDDFRIFNPLFFSLNENVNKFNNFHHTKTISEIINNDDHSAEFSEKKIEDSSKCRSIISFNTLLIHTYRIFNLQRQRDDFEHTIDPKTLLSTIKLDTFHTSEDTECFFLLLWKVRYAFDKYVVKWRFEEDDDNDEKLLLTDINTSRSYEKNYFSRTNSSYSPSQMLQSVLYFTGGFTQQYWLTPFLAFLLENQDLTSNQIHEELEKIDNLMLPGDKKEISIQLASQAKRNEKVDSNTFDILDQTHGTSFNHYWFYKLEYILWKNWIDRQDVKFKNYRITSKNSVEHVFPQNHEFGDKLEFSEHDWLNSFGNLGLLSVGENSKYNNQDVEKKKVDFDKKETYDSLKLAKVYSQNIKNWDIEKIRNHQNSMKLLIFEHYK
ncbi:DUF262 domain-containing protein [Chryseobacterium indoltheticum]|uniref:Uncharacterized conserved protein n=1 Tax=Chryseobacterium indoltheticum TaxID=254 RepID=A0A381FBN7_9FLAO|nr:DUF262 domain-containing protein [Chryseobacterium indoltheticum]AZA73787.1 DUF262 domain-containing protein [Chryseobacterium indoltheticum]SIQ95272.1 Protein of unknown function [Chryseobacterium indoltheticum]SUX44006.1 Uncharacterized conserved protein [Chryseobacterium indoltheticum]